MRKIIAVCFFLILLFSAAAADMPQLHGYNKEMRPQYQYVTFGTYPQGKNGEVEPVLWRVLGPGVPGIDDVINAANCPVRDDKMPVNGDDFTEETQDVFVLMTEYIIDFIMYHDQKDKNGEPLDYVDSMM